MLQNALSSLDVPLTIGGVALLALGLLTMLSRPVGSPQHSVGGTARELVLHLSPVILLMIAFPLATPRMDVTVGDTSLITVVLASAVTVPWLSQCVCMPLYRSIGHLLPYAGPQSRPLLVAECTRAWPRTLFQTLPALVLFVVPMQLMMQWSAQTLACYIILSLLHAVFAQSIVLCNVTTNRTQWAAAWLAYAAAVLLVPTWWYLPPIVATLVHVWPMRRALLDALSRFNPVTIADPASAKAALGDAIAGYTTGSMLWADKWLLFVVLGGTFDVNVVYFALLPAVIVYNFYFVKLTPSFDTAIGGVRKSLEQRSFSHLRVESTRLRGVVHGAFGHAAVVGTFLSLGLCALAVVVAPSKLPLFAAVCVASWFMCGATIAAYKIDYAGGRRTSGVIGGIYLALAAMALSGLDPTPAYVVVAGAAAAAMIAAYSAALASWRNPAYSLFWKHATSW